jgi:diguanylate cyclase (GGDEF)-like protein
MQIIMNQYICFVALWCLVINTFIVFSSSNVKALEQRDKKKMEKIIYCITAVMMLSDLDTYMFAGMNAKWVYWNLEIVNYSMYLLKYLYLTVFTLFIMKESGRFVKVKKILLAFSILCGTIGIICISLPDIRKEFYYIGSDNYFYYNRLYGIIRVLIILDVLVLLIALLLEKKQYSKKTFHLYLGYVFLLAATAFFDYVIDTWYLQNLAIFFSSMIISIDHMTQVSDQWLDTKKELLFSEYRASHDIMTGLWNKTSGMDQVRNCLENMLENDAAVLGFVDIDNFKSVNDTYGHGTGDFWIREIAAALQEMCGSSDIACRYGGDEYILFLQNIGNLDDLTERIEGFRKKVHDKAAEREQDVHCSIGLYQVKGAGKKLAECVIIADGLLYQAKKNGKDTYVIG